MSCMSHIKGISWWWLIKWTVDKLKLQQAIPIWALLWIISWAGPSISATVSKANKFLGLLRQNLYSCSPFVKETAYKSLVQPKIECCSSIWGPYHEEYENKHESVKRRATRFVFNDFRRQSHVSDMLRDLNWKTLEDRRTIYRLNLLHKWDHSIVAINIDEHYTNHEIRNITTRKTSSISFAHPTARMNCYRYSFILRTVAEWNRLSATMREAPPVDTLMARLCNIRLSTHFTRYKIAYSRPIAAMHVLMQLFISYVLIWL